MFLYRLMNIPSWSVINKTNFNNKNVFIILGPVYQMSNTYTVRSDPAFKNKSPFSIVAVVPYKTFDLKKLKIKM